MGDWDEFEGDSGFLETTDNFDSFEDSSTDSSEILDVSETFDSAESFDSLENDFEPEESHYVENVMDSADVETLEFDDDIPMEESVEIIDYEPEIETLDLESDTMEEIETLEEIETTEEIEALEGREATEGFNTLEQDSETVENIEVLETGPDVAESHENNIDIMNDVCPEELEFEEDNSTENAQDIPTEQIGKTPELVEENFTDTEPQIESTGLPSNHEIVETQETEDIAENVGEIDEVKNSIDNQMEVPEEFMETAESLETSEIPRHRDTIDNEDSPKTMTRDITPGIIETREHDTEETLENYRNNLREYDVDEEQIEEFINQERDKINTEYDSLDHGDTYSNIYYQPNNWSEIANSLMNRETAEWQETGTASESDLSGVDIESAESNEVSEVVESDNIVQEISETVNETEISEIPPKIDYDEILEGLDEYDFDGIDYCSNPERLDASLDSFQMENWEHLSLDEQKGAMSDLAEYIIDVTKLENPPEMVFYNNPVKGEYGGFSPSKNTLSINEYMLNDSNEAADTVAHELWHAYQHQKATNPQTAKDYAYQYNFEHYISPKQDKNGHFVNFNEYQDQLVEAEARAFADQFKGRLHSK